MTSPFRADGGADEPFHRRRGLRAPEVGSGLVVRKGIRDDAVEIVPAQRGHVVLDIVDHADRRRVQVDLPPASHERDALGGKAAQRDERQAAHPALVAQRPPDDLRNPVEGARVDGHVEVAVDAANVRQQVGELLPERVQLPFVPIGPPRPPLARVDVEAHLDKAGVSQFDQQFPGQALAVGDDDGVQAAVSDEAHDLDDVRVDQRFTAGQVDVVDVPPSLQELDLGLDVVKGLVAGQRRPIAPLARDVARVGDLDPADRIVVQAPWQPIEPLRARTVVADVVLFHVAGTRPAAPRPAGRTLTV